MPDATRAATSLVHCVVRAAAATKRAGGGKYVRVWCQLSQSVIILLTFQGDGPPQSHLFILLVAVTAAPMPTLQLMLHDISLLHSRQIHVGSRCLFY